MTLFNNDFSTTFNVLRYVLLTACLFVGAEMYGQQSNARGPVKFTCVSWDKLSFDELYYRENQKYVPLEVIPYKRSKAYTITGMSALELFIQDVDENGRLQYRLVGQAPMLPNTRRMLFFIVEPAGVSEVPLKVVGMDDSLKAFPRGAFRFFNMSNALLKVGFGDAVEPIKPRSTCIIEPEIKNNGSFIPFVVADEQGKKIYETRLIGQMSGREMVFIMLPTESNKRVAVKFISQVIPRRTQSAENE